MNCYPVFFNVVQDSLINSAITITMKLYDKNRDSFTISKVINTLENNKDIFLNEYESIYHFPENSKMEADKITFTIDKLKLFEIAKEKIRTKEKIISDMKTKRDNYYMHLDEKYIKDFSELDRECPISINDVKNLLEDADEILNSFYSSIKGIKLKPKTKDIDDVNELLKNICYCNDI